MNLKKILAVVLSMTLLVSCLVSGMSLNTSATTPDPETDAKTKLEAAWAALEYKPVVVHDGFWKKTTNDNGANWNWPGSAAASDSELELADGTKIPAYSVAASTDTPSDKEAFIVSDKNSYNRPTSNVPVVAGTKLYFYVSGATDGISAFYCRANEDVSFYPTFTKEMITDNVGETWTKYGCTVKSDDDNSLVNQKLGRLQFSDSTQIFGKKVSAVLIQDPITVPQENSLLELVKKAENIDLNEIQDGEAKNNFVSALAAAVEVLYTTDANTISYLTYKWGKMSRTPEVVFGNFYEKDSSWTDKTSGSTYNENIGAKVYTPSKANFIITPDLSEGNINILTNMIKIQEYAEIYLYYSATSAYSVDASVGSENDKGGVSINSTGVTISLPATVGGALVKFDLKSAITGNSKYNSSDYDGTSKAWGRLQFGSANNGLTISQVFGVKPIVVPDTTDKTLGDVIALAEAEDLSVYQDNAAKTEFEAALAKANAIYLSSEDNAKAAIIAAWKNVKNNPEILFGNFHKGSGWPVVDPSGTENGIPYYANPDKGSNFIIGGSSYSSNKEGFLPDEYEDFFVYIATSADIDKTYLLAFPADETNNNDQVSANNDVKFKLSSTGGALVKYSLKANMTKGSAYTNQKLGRLHITSKDSAITKISYVYGVKPLDLATAFSDVFDAEGNAKDLTLAQLIDAYTKYDIEKNYDAAELIAAVNDFCAVNPKYAAFKTVAGYANKVKQVVQVSPPDYATNKGITVTKVSNTSPEGVPTLDLYTVGEFGTTTFTGKGLDVLGTTGHSTGFVRYSSVLSTFNSNTNGLYLSYYIPSDKVPATTPIKIQVHYRGTLSSGNTNYNTAYLKQITLTERDKWAVLDLNDLKVDGLSTLTALENILVDVCAEADQEVTMYFSPFAFTNSANYINTAGATTLTDYAKKYNATAFTEGERYVYEADFIAARDAFNLALADGYKLQGQGLYNKTGDSHIYTEDGTNYYAGYRIFAQYICPLDGEGKPITNKIIVDGKEYNLNKRCILVAKNEGSQGTGELTADTENAKMSEASGDALNNYWDFKKIDDKTAIVTYSLLLRNVKEDQTNNNYHQARAMIEYNDGTSNVQIYSKTESCGTIKQVHDKLCIKDGKDYEWFPAAAQ